MDVDGPDTIHIPGGPHDRGLQNKKPGWRPPFKVAMLLFAAVYAGLLFVLCESNTAFSTASQATAVDRAARSCNMTIEQFQNLTSNSSYTQASATNGAPGLASTGVAGANDLLNVFDGGLLGEGPSQNSSTNGTGALPPGRTLAPPPDQSMHRPAPR